jgi:hypothetical protein
MLLMAVAVAGLAALAAGPDPGVPPRPFFPDYFFGTVLLQEVAPPAGTQLMACVDDCDNVFASAPVRLSEGGAFSGLAVGPRDENLVGHPVRFYLVNQYGRIPAAQTVTFAGALELQRVTLTFHQPLPSLASAPTPPAVGDWVVPTLPKVALGLGAAMALAGMSLLAAAHRRGFWWGRPTAPVRSVSQSPSRLPIDDGLTATSRAVAE